MQHVVADLLPPLRLHDVPPQLRQLGGALLLEDDQQLGLQARQRDRTVGLLRALLGDADGQACGGGLLETCRCMLVCLLDGGSGKVIKSEMQKARQFAPSQPGSSLPVGMCVMRTPARREERQGRQSVDTASISAVPFRPNHPLTCLHLVHVLPSLAPRPHRCHLQIPVGFLNDVLHQRASDVGSEAGSRLTT